MGWCADFGTWIDKGCGHPMTAASTSCTCDNCGARCPGKFSGCREVWAAGPVTGKAGIRPALLAAPSAASPVEGSPGRQQELPVTDRDHPSVEDRLRDLEAAATRISDDLHALRRAAAVPADDRRHAALEKRLDRIALDLVEGIGVVWPLQHALEAQQGQIHDLGDQLRATRGVVARQQADLDRMKALAEGSPRDRLKEVPSRMRPGARPDGESDAVLLDPVTGRRALPPLPRPRPASPLGAP